VPCDLKKEFKKGIYNHFFDASCEATAERYCEDATTGKHCDCERGLLCAAHNRLAAEHVFGLELMNQKMRDS
jgi:hypothetical protein